MEIDGIDYGEVVDEFFSDESLREKWPNKKDLTGVKANGWTVVRYHRRTTKSKQAHWLVRCDQCGREQVHTSSNIRKKIIGKCRICHPKVPPLTNKRLKQRVAELEERVAYLQRELQRYQDDEL